MRKLTVFNHISLDGYFVDAKGDMSWAHSQDPEFMAFTSENASGESEMVFGRVTYDMMAGFWPTPQAHEAMPDVAEAMNKMPKVVFSRTLDKAAWRNTRLVTGDPAVEIRRMKDETGPDLIIFGSGTIVSRLTQARLVDEYQVVLNPIVLGSGRTMFEGVEDKLNLTLTNTRPFKNGNVVLWYEPAE
jgi:dihydrofolate reductase